MGRALKVGACIGGDRKGKAEGTRGSRTRKGKANNSIRRDSVSDHHRPRLVLRPRQHRPFSPSFSPVQLASSSVAAAGLHAAATMLPKVANHLIHHTSRAVIAVQNQTGHTLRNVLQLQSSSGPTTAVTGWGSSVSGAGPHSGPGPSKFHTSSRLHTTPTGPPLSASQVRERVEKLSAFRASSSPRSQNVIADPSSDPSQLVRSGFGTYATLISTLTDRDFENYEAVRRAEARLRRRRRAAIGESAEEEEQRIADLRGDSHFASAFALFQTAAVNPNSKFPLHIYNKLLRSCAIHSNAHAAQAVYAHLEKRSDIHPDAQTFISLIATYASSKDVQGAEKMFEKFRDASRLDRIQWSFDAIRPDASAYASQYLQRAAQMAVWNEMLAAYFRCGQPSDALALLEQMMDSSAGDVINATDVPPPSSATFSCTINGFCQLGDVPTALAWFERMLQQQGSASVDPFEPALIPRRPDQETWTAMFDALADEGMVAELNRLFARWLEVAPDDGSAVLSDHRDTVLAANLRFMDTRADLPPAKALELLDFLSGHVLPWSVDRVHFTFNREISRTLSERLVMQYWNRGHTDQAITLAERIASRQLQVLEYGQALETFDSSKTQSRIEGTRRFVTDLVTDILGSTTSGISLTHLLRLSGLLADVGALHSAAFSEACLNAYALQRNSPTLALSTREWEALLDVILSGDAEAVASLNTLVDDLLQHSVDITQFSEHAKGQLPLRRAGERSTLPASKFATFPGSSAVFLQGLVSGSAGIIGALPNVAPKAHAELYRLFKAGKLQEAEKLQALLGHADWELQKLGSIAGIKAVVSKHFGYGNTNVRGPLTPRDLDAVGAAATAKLEELIALEKSL
ncbi:hypothetical protein NUW54_g7600 [Trametes sanguinea]|uniref:Uncharacterized protein n=1 Tax=Trametes sanguinea TaxID=158606 RepID=A0ACC1PM77_9APHY|nr:hypothetical protein NUW54_g7600 [Trametes sanguinea]